MTKLNIDVNSGRLVFGIRYAVNNEFKDWCFAPCTATQDRMKDIANRFFATLDGITLIQIGLKDRDNNEITVISEFDGEWRTIIPGIERIVV